MMKELVEGLNRSLVAVLSVFIVMLAVTPARYVEKTLYAWVGGVLVVGIVLAFIDGRRPHGT